MITDKLANTNLYEKLGGRIAKAFDFLKKTNLTKLENGRHDIEGSDIFVSVSSYETKPLSEGKYEAHKDYIDIQCVIEGIERLYYGPLDTMQETEPYIKERDIAFYKGAGDYVTALPGMFTIFYPTDAHMPNIAVDKPSPVKKIVVKIRIN
jgi:YhcH/YjgK/YiaL family protein